MLLDLKTGKLGLCVALATAATNDRLLWIEFAARVQTVPSPMSSLNQTDLQQRFEWPRPDRRPASPYWPSRQLERQLRTTRLAQSKCSIESATTRQIRARNIGDKSVWLASPVILILHRGDKPRTQKLPAPQTTTTSAMWASDLAKENGPSNSSSRPDRVHEPASRGTIPMFVAKSLSQCARW